MAASPVVSRSWRQLWGRWVKEPYGSLVNRIERLRFPKLWSNQLNSDDANISISRLLQEKQPFLVGRIGHTEGRILGEYLFRNRRYSRLTRKEAHQFSGIFPVAPELLDCFAEIYGGAIANSDLLGFWQTAFQAQLLSVQYPTIPITSLSALEPYLHVSPWSANLAGLRVVVVHPFAQSIITQYTTKRVSLFTDQRVLPQFSLQVVAPPQTLAPLTGGFTDWLLAYQDLVSRVLEREFDVALLGCGAYGLPLGAAIKASGRQAIHLGGALQILFGIRGKRWDQLPMIAALMNDHWVRPAFEETPISASRVDGACYW